MLCGDFQNREGGELECGVWMVTGVWVWKLPVPLIFEVVLLVVLAGARAASEV